MSFPFYDPKQAEYHFVELTKRGIINRQKRLSLKEDEIYIAFQDPQSIPPIPVNIPNGNAPSIHFP